MKKILLLGASLLWAAFMMAAEAPFQKAEIKTIMRKVADWQIANPHQRKKTVMIPTING